MNLNNNKILLLNKFFLSNFIKKYFISPFKEGTGYNIINTTVYAVLLALIVYFIYYLIKNYFLILF